MNKKFKAYYNLHGRLRNDQYEILSDRYVYGINGTNSRRLLTRKSFRGGGRFLVGNFAEGWSIRLCLSKS